MAAKNAKAAPKVELYYRIKITDGTGYNTFTQNNCNTTFGLRNLNPTLS
ncbi:MAG: hypothetical protein WC856_18105 [Methylococcaceae bacterium]